MYLTRFAATNLRLIREMDLRVYPNPASGSGPRMWTAILAENGHCKTSILQSIAMCLSGNLVANQFRDISSLRDLRSNSEMVVKVGAHYLTAGSVAESVFVSGGIVSPGSSEWLSVVTLEEEAKSTLAELDVMLEQKMHERKDVSDILKLQVDIVRVYQNSRLQRIRNSNTPGNLVVAYGTNRVLQSPGATDFPDNPARQRVSSLLLGEPIIGTDFVGHFGAVYPELVEPYIDALNQVMNDPELFPELGNFIRRGRDGDPKAPNMALHHRVTLKTGGEDVVLPTTWLSQGYQSLLSVIADLIGQAFWDQKKPLELDEIQGLALIDEIDLHIHPKWQVRIVPALKRLFPKMQFIVTTHSPLVLTGLEPDEIVRLVMDENGNVVVAPQGPAPALMTATALLEEYFGVRETYPHKLGEAMARYGFLVGDPGRSPKEDAELQELQATLAKHGVDPGWEPVPIDPALQRKDSP